MGRNFNGRQNNNPNRNGSGVGSANGNGRTQNGGDSFQRHLVNGSDFFTVSKNHQTVEFTTKQIEAFFQEQARRIDSAVFDRATKIAQNNGMDTNAIEKPDTRISIISINLSGDREERPYVPFFMATTANILDINEGYDEMPEVFKSNLDDGVHINGAYYDYLFRPFMYGKDFRKYWNSTQWRREMHITQKYHTLNEMRGYLLPKVEKPDKDRDNRENWRIGVIIDPIQVFHKILVDRQNPRQEFRVIVKESRKLDKTNYWFRVDKELNTKRHDMTDSIGLLKEFLSKGNSGL